MNIKFINKLCTYINERTVKPVNFYVELSDSNAMVLETDSNYVYFICEIDVPNQVFTMNTIYFDKDLNHLFEENENFLSLKLAMNKILSIIKTLTNTIN